MTTEEMRAQLVAKVTRAAAFAGSYIVHELKGVLSTPAPLVPGANPPRAATKATPGAPPRKVSGRGRASVVYVVEPPGETSVTVLVGSNVVYMGVHERGNHKWLKKTIEAVMPKVITRFNAVLAKG